MSHDEQEEEFQAILAALGERELTDWERERLWELLEENPERIASFSDHCFVGAELGAITDHELLEAGIELPIRNVVTMPSSHSSPAALPKWRYVAATVALVAAIVIFLVGPSSGPVASDATDLVIVKPALEFDAQPAEAMVARQANLSLDDPNDEAVALSGSAALANSRNPRGGKPEGAATVPGQISFNHHVRPILSENCFFCHGPDEKTQEAGLRLDKVEAATADLGGYAAIVPGNAEKSEVWLRILSDDPDELMPPADSHRELSPADREILRRWINDGAQYDPHWAFMTPEKTELPALDSDWIKNPIDTFILERLTSENLVPNSPASARTLLRRISLDLTGLPPLPVDLAAFEKQYDDDPDKAISDAVTHILASPHFGERMALAWLDAARYGDSNGFQQDGNRHQWPWRDWVVKAYNENMPFDQFTIEQIAGDLLENPRDDQIIATAFNRNHMLNGEGGAIKEEQRINYVIDRVDTTATTWLGLTMACAQCHTHKYDPIQHEEYYQFFAFFNNVPETGGVDMRSGSGCAFGSGATVQLSRPLLTMPTEAQTAEQERLKVEVKRLEGEIKKQTPAIDEKRREWEKTYTLAELVDRTRFPGNVSSGLRTEEEKRNARQKQEIVDHYLAQFDHHQNEEWKQIGASVKKARTDLRKIGESILQVMVMADNPPDKMRETFILERGDYQQPTEKVSAGTPAFLPAMKPDTPRNRLGLAKWLVDPAHPLTARVTVNRIWQQFFGIGIVKTAEDFGVQGELPVHPGLLDWLAVEFVESGWDVKHLISLIVSSSAYRQDSKITPKKKELDPENRLVARGARYRLPAMVLRDQALAVSGLIIEDIGGEPVYPHQPEGLWKDFSFGKISYPHQTDPAQLHRRSLYSFWRRTSSPPNLFDSSNRQVCMVKSSITNTPLHALTLLNDITYVEAARALAGRMKKEGGSTPGTQLRFAFELATGRLPDEREKELLLNGYARSLNEFASFKPEASTYAATEKDAVELAALTRMAQVILNLDETLNRP
ncbi:PSD1 and planctomycete cytochrome C domain-containing protein [Verrucomicrobiales bacterium]|nr:PSD1 and planctomycete cytochrome C domain-containing protein [Verrucomicrobiales bacterium]